MCKCIIDKQLVEMFYIFSWTWLIECFSWQLISTVTSCKITVAIMNVLTYEMWASPLFVSITIT